MLKFFLCFLLPLGISAQARTDRPCEIVPPSCDCSTEIAATLAALKKNKAFKRQDPEVFAAHLKRVSTELTADPDGNLNCSFYLGYLLFGIKDGHAYARSPVLENRCTAGTEEYYQAIRESEYFTKTPRYPGSMAALRKEAITGEDTLTGMYYSASGTGFAVLAGEEEGEYAGFILSDSLPNWEAGQEYFRFFALPEAYGVLMRDNMHRPYFYRGKSMAGALRSFGLSKEKEAALHHRPAKELVSGKVVHPAPGIAYVYLESFSGSNTNVNALNNSYDRLGRQLETINHLIIDVRSNGGGGERAFKKLLKRLDAHSGPLQLHLLVNEETASAAELFALEVKERNARVYGEPTRGTLAYGYGNKGPTPAFLTPCGQYRVQLTERVNRPKSLINFEYSGIPVEVLLDHNHDWLEQVLQAIN